MNILGINVRSRRKTKLLLEELLRNSKRAREAGDAILTIYRLLDDRSDLYKALEPVRDRVFKLEGALDAIRWSVEAGRI